ncbi:MAG: hypothetical protein ACXVD0_06550 [Nocardioides sp.]
MYETTITRTAAPTTCASYDPGHHLHWHQWKQASAAECVPVLDVVQSGTSLEVIFPDRPSVHWHHHDADALAVALRGNRTQILASTTFQALRVDGHWFNCAGDVTTLAACV